MANNNQSTFNVTTRGGHSVQAKFLYDSSGIAIVNPRTGQPYIAPATYNIDDAISYGHSISIGTLGPIDSFTTLFNEFRAGRSQDLQRAYNGSNSGTGQDFVEDFRDIASFHFGLVAEAAGVGESIATAGGGIYNGVKDLWGANIDSSGEWWNNPRNPPNISAGSQFYNNDARSNASTNPVQPQTIGDNVEELVQNITESIESGLAPLNDAIDVINSTNYSFYRSLVLQAVANARNNCFDPQVPIEMWPLDLEFMPDPSNPLKQYDQDAVRTKIWTKPIELIRVGDYVVSHDKNGNMVPGYVPRTFQNNAKVLLNFHGTRVTPGHVYYRPDSRKANKYETLIDVLRDDGVIEHRDGEKLRAATNVPVGDPRDGFVQAVTQTRRSDGTFVEKDAGRIRLGTRFLVGEGEDRKSWAVADLIEAGGGVVGEDELIRVDGGEPMPFLWDFGETLPKPEDFVLACSGTTLEDIYKAAEWESQGPRLAAPMVLDGGPVQPLKGAALSAMPRNEPLNVTQGTPSESVHRNHSPQN